MFHNVKLNFAKRNTPDFNYKLSSLKVNMEYCTISVKNFWNSTRSKPWALRLKNRTKCDKVFHIVKQKRLFYVLRAADLLPEGPERKENREYIRKNGR